MAMLRLAGNTAPSALARRRALGSAVGWISSLRAAGPSVCAFTTATTPVGGSSGGKCRGSGNSKKYAIDVRASAAPLSLEPRYVMTICVHPPPLFSLPSLLL
jgi:hypothetical protein